MFEFNFTSINTICFQDLIPRVCLTPKDPQPRPGLEAWDASDAIASRVMANSHAIDILTWNSYMKNGQEGGSEMSSVLAISNEI